MRAHPPIGSKSWRRQRGLGAILAGVALLGTACGTSATSAGAPRPAPSAATTKHAGTVDVLSAGSLQILMDKSVGPGFHRATGYTLVNTSHGSSALAADIKAKTQVADVFVSASPAVNATLEGAANGNWVSWYATFASSPEVLGYYPKSRFAAAIRKGPWYKVITQPGFLVGRTNPSADPGGVLQVTALDQTAQAKHLPALETLARESKDEYDETALEGDVESGQLDAAFMYLADANSDRLPHANLTGVDLAGTYTITVVNRAPHRAAAEAFVKYLLSRAGQAVLRADQFRDVPPQVTGTGVPSGLQGLLGS